MCGINHDKIQQRLLAEKDLSYAKALELANSIEAAEKGSRDIKNSQATGSSSTVNWQGSGHGRAESRRYSQQRHSPRGNDQSKPKGDSKDYHQKAEKSKIVCYRGGGEHLAPVCKFKTSKCGYCHKLGHIEKMCKFKNKARSTYAVSVDEDHHDDGSPYVLFNVQNEAEDVIKEEVLINSYPLKMEVDTGAALSLISSGTYHSICKASKVQGEPLKETTVCLKTYTVEHIIILGVWNVNVESKGQKLVLPLYVVEGSGPSLMGRNWIKELKANVPGFFSVTEDGHGRVKEIVSTYKNVFEKDLGTIKGFKAKFNVKPDAQPKFFKSRSVPFTMKSLVETELNRLVSEKIISPVQSSQWAAPIVPVLKQNGSVRICGDFKVTINQVTEIESYPLPRVEELFAAMSGGKQFTKLDLSQAYLQIELEEESKQFVTINTHQGLFQFNRLPFGVSSAPAIFQRGMENLLRGCKNVAIYIDDILITGPTQEEHLKTLEKVLSILDEANVRLNYDKCQFLRSQVEYLGYVIDEHGLHPTEKKIQAIKEAPTPTNITELRAFLGIINYYGKFLPNLSSQLVPLHELLQKNTTWKWNKAQESAFQSAKNALQADSLLVHLIVQSL